jgi:hypothetical protein
VKFAIVFAGTLAGSWAAVILLKKISDRRTYDLTVMPLRNLR